LLQNIRTNQSFSFGLLIYEGHLEGDINP